MKPLPRQTSPSQKPRVLIVGAGMAGLACACRLQDQGASPLLLDAQDVVGGRVRTDQTNGFLIDRGFQVFLDAYPETSRLLDLEALDLRPFLPGAIVIRDGYWHRLMDVFRCPSAFLSTLLQPIGDLRDKWLIGQLRRHLLRLSEEEIMAQEERSTEAFLRDFGFSETMIEGFFRPFYGGIFLERELQTSHRFFAFTFRMFAQGRACVPATGMQAIPKQLASRLPADQIRLGTAVRSLDSRSVTLASGEQLSGDAVVVATDGTVAQQLVPSLSTRSELRWHPMVAMSFSADVPPFRTAIIALNGDPASTSGVNNVSVMSEVAPGYAPADKALMAVTVLGEPTPGLEGDVRRDLSRWFGHQVESWELIREDVIPRALPQLPPGAPDQPRPLFREAAGVLICGDHCATPSIEGAVRSGLAAADRAARLL